MKAKLILILLSLSLISCQQKKVTVKAYFTTDKTEYALNEPIIIDNQTVVENGYLGLCHWKWGDSNSSFEQNLRSVSFGSFGEYTISLTAYADGGGAQDTYSTKIMVKDGDEPTTGTYYVSSNGSGDGRSIDHPMAFSRFVSILSGNNLADYDGNAFYIQSGTYVFKSNAALEVKSTSSVFIKIIGGVSMAGVSGETDFNGEGGHPVLAVGSNVRLSVSNCTFSGSSGSAIETNDASAKLNLSNCRFQNNQGEKGGALAVSYGTVTANDCSFIGNVATNCGGAVCIQGEGTADFIGCTFRSNHTQTSTSSYNGHYGGAVDVRGSALARFNGCVFSGNYATGGGVFNLSDAKDATTYLNACVFINKNYITYRYGTCIVAYKNCGKLCMNNCSFADDTYGANIDSGPQAVWISLAPGTLVISNCSLIGNLRKTSSLKDWSDDRGGLVRFDGGGGTHYFINNIIAPRPKGKDTKAVVGNGNANALNAFSNKTYTIHTGSSYNPGSWTTWNPAGSSSNTDANDFKGSEDYFVGLSWESDGTMAGSCWRWNGTLLGGSNNDKASLEDVNKAIREADRNFYDWLSSIDALSRDGRGMSRGASTWPGAYQE